MSWQRTIYRSNGGGVTKVTTKGHRSSLDDGFINLPFHERVMKGYYTRECEMGSRFKSGFNKNQIKKAWTETYREVPDVTVE